MSLESFRRLLRDGRIKAQPGNVDPAIHTCHCRGWIYERQVIIEPPIQSTFYSFASPLHAAIISWMLAPTDDLPRFASLYDLSIKVISRFVPSRLASREPRVGAGFSERPPEALYQDEFYRCLFDVTRGNVAISPEFATAQKARKEGRIDFFIPNAQWGIELTRDGDRLNEHASRFRAKGAHDECNILLDFRTTNVSDPHPNIPFLYHIVFQKEYQQVCVYNNMLEKVAEMDLENRV
ncbi:hypothetical protein APHAL10511_005346 [Amanita phalloides]|nr:hypothetical protein APHAL10511_005346 [Amanita phalloides]